MNAAIETITLEQRIERERQALAKYLKTVLSPMASVSSSLWGDIDQLDKLLKVSITYAGNSKLVYAVGCDGRQLSSNISSDHIDTSKRGQELSVRPYMANIAQADEFVLSPIYVDKNDHRPCVTALHKVQDDEGKIIGCVAADYDLSVLPTSQDAVDEVPSAWRQIKGDPAIRQNLFQQARVNSAMDQRLDEVNDILTDLITQRGIFHAKLHYSSSRATLWVYDDPHRYRLHVLDEIINPSVCLAYPRKPYPSDATVSEDKVADIFKRLAELRNADETIYLRSGSLNVVNGMVGLTFSCDGSHYMSADEFLAKPDSFWFGCA